MIYGTAGSRGDQTNRPVALRFGTRALRHVLSGRISAAHRNQFAPRAGGGSGCLGALPSRIRHPRPEVPRGGGTGRRAQRGANVPHAGPPALLRFRRAEFRRRRQAYNVGELPPLCRHRGRSRLSAMVLSGIHGVHAAHAALRSFCARGMRGISRRRHPAQRTLGSRQEHGGVRLRTGRIHLRVRRLHVDAGPGRES